MMAMSALKVGDVVRVGAATYSKVYMFTHKDAEVKAKFTKIFTSTGKTLRLTSGHYLYVWCTKLPPSTSFFANSRRLMGCTDPLRRGVGAPHQCPLDSVASYLCHFMLMCGCTIR